MSDRPLSLYLLQFYPKKLASVFIGWIASRRLPKRILRTLLRYFVRYYQVDLSEAEKPLEEYRSFQDFFTRRLLSGLRPQDEMALGAINCPVDGRLIAIGRIQSGMLIQAKGCLIVWKSCLNT